MAHTWTTAGFGYWGYLRQLAARTGTRLEESKGLLSRTFTFYGTDTQVKAVAATLSELEYANQTPNTESNS